jgi:hypothetical protein
VSPTARAPSPRVFHRTCGCPEPGDVRGFSRSELESRPRCRCDGPLAAESPARAATPRRRLLARSGALRLRRLSGLDGWTHSRLGPGSCGWRGAGRCAGPRVFAPGHARAGARAPQRWRLVGERQAVLVRGGPITPHGIHARGRSAAPWRETRSPRRICHDGRGCDPGMDGLRGRPGGRGDSREGWSGRGGRGGGRKVSSGGVGGDPPVWRRRADRGGRCEG